MKITTRILMMTAFFSAMMIATSSTTITKAVHASISLLTGEDIETTQDEFTRNMEEAMEEVQREETAELFGGEENVPTTEEFMDEAIAEGDVKRSMEREQMAENGIEIDEAAEEPIATAAEVRPKGYDTEFAIQFIHETFAKIVDIEPTNIEEYEEELDPDEGEVPRQTIYYEFDPDNTDDDVRIYTAQGQTVQGLATHIATHLNSTDITLYDDGRAMIVCEGKSLYESFDDTTIYAPHNYTADNGYRYTDNTIMSPTGQQLLSTAYGLHGVEDYIAEGETQQC